MHRRFLAVLKQLAPQVSAPPPPGIQDLTPTEKEVIRRIVYTDDKFSTIWCELGISKRSFDTHLDSIYQKLGTRKRSGLVREVLLWGVA